MVPRGRAPQGARGLKYFVGVRGDACLLRRAPQGARGLKSFKRFYASRQSSRAPQGARGLKFHQLTRQRKRTLVAPRKGRVG